MLKKWLLSERGYRFVCQELHHGSTLAIFISESLTSKGSCETLLPEEINLDSMVDLSTSVYLSDNVNLHDTRGYVEEIVSEYLQGEETNCVVIETFLKPTDFLQVERSEPYFFFKNEVYYYLTKGASIENIRNAVLDARAYPKIIILSSSYKVIHKGDVIKEEDLRLMAKNVNMLIIGAFDEEGFIFWSRKEKQ